MRIKVVTNNAKVDKEIVPENCELHVVEGTALDVLKASRDMVLAGWHLASDPLAGYRFRGNPYHTVFLQGIYQDEEASALEVLRIEQCMFPHDKKDLEGTANEKLKKDYCELDFSIAMSTLNGAIQNILRGCHF